MIFDFFGGEITTSGYVENNMEYVDEYLNVLNENITKNLNGYVPLSRILYFYLEDEKKSFSEYYKNNLDIESKVMLDINTVCEKTYSFFNDCKDSQIESSNQNKGISYKPFNSPIDMSKASITSFFAQQRIVFDNYDVHYAWDLAAPENTPVYSVGEGVVTEVRFNQTLNINDTNNGGGNYIKIKYEIEDKTFIVTYAHLYPKSSLVKVGDNVSHNQKRAEVGTTGYSTGNHLHYEVKMNDESV